MINLITLKGFIKKEFLHILRDKKMIAVLFFIPTMQMIMFGLALTSEVKNIDFAIMSKPSVFTREIQKHALASGYFKEVKNINTEHISNPAELLISGKAEAVLILPYKNHGNPLESAAPAQLLVNAINAQRAQQISAYITQIIEQISAEHGINSPMPVDVDMRILYNHYMDTKHYMVPALIIMASFLVILLVCTMTITKEKETGTMEKLISSPVHTIEILAGKTVPFFIIGMAIMSFMLCVGIFCFGLPIHAALWQLAINAAVLDACALSIATLISTIAKTQQQAMMGCILVLLPAILLSGIMFPVENIPVQFRWLCYINPMMYGAASFRNAILKGGDFIFFWKYFFICAAMAIILAAIAWKNFKAKFN